jgi:tetratricopeptide (TPR) repeat protein
MQMLLKCMISRYQLEPKATPYSWHSTREVMDVMQARNVAIVFVASLILLCISVSGQTYTADYWFQKGNEFLKNESYVLAEKCFDKAIELNPQYERAWIDKGISLSHQKEYDDAIMVLNKAIEINPRDEVVLKIKDDILKIETAELVLEGDKLAISGKYDEAIKALDKATEINPNDEKSGLTKAVFSMIWANIMNQ